jgi:hypothetical protein
MKRIAGLMLLAALALPASARAAASGHSQVAQGSFEISPTITYSHENLKREGYGGVENFSRLDFTPTLGYCVSNHYEVTGGMIIRHESVNGSSDTSVGAVAGLTYNFNASGNMIPFASVGFGALFNGGFDFSEPAVLAPTLAAGVRVLAGDTGSVNLSLGYQRESNDHMRQNRIVAGAGVSLFPWRHR